LKIVHNIYRFEIFNKFFYKKCQEIEGLNACLEEITNYMIENTTFIDIPFEQFSESTNQVLSNLFDESLIIRKDLVEIPGIAFATKNVVNFVYDEFREYLLASALLRSWQNDPDNTLIRIEKFIQESHLIAEGLQKYLCSWAIREPDYKLIENLEKIELFNDVFLENIFAMPDQDISEKLIEILERIFWEGTGYTRRIIYHLTVRCNPKIFRNLSIQFFIDQISRMNTEQYKSLVQFALLDDYRYVNTIFQGCINAFREGRVSPESKMNILMFMMSLTGVEDKKWHSRDNDLERYPALTTILEIRKHYSEDEIRQAAVNMLSGSQIPIIRENIKHFIDRPGD